jgi:hypothetical protein
MEGIWDTFGAVPPPFSIASLGVWPILWGYVLVELASVIVPAWRPLRIPGVGRARLERAAAVTAAAVAFIRAVDVARSLATVHAGSHTIAAAQGAAFFVPVVSTLVAATCLVLWLARVIDRPGVGRGMSMLLALSALTTVPGLALGLQPDLGTGGPLPRLLVVIVLTIGGSLLVLTNRSGGGSGLRLPSAGLDPVLYMATYLANGWRPLRKLANSAFPILRWSQAALAIRLVAVVAITAVLTRAYNADARRSGLRSAIVRSSLYLLAICLASAFEPDYDLLALVTVTAVALDLGFEIWFRLGNGEVAAAARFQKPDEADDAVERLRRAGVAAVAQGATHRTLFHFFGPFVPVDVLVPTADVAAASRALSPEAAAQGGAVELTPP